MNKEDYRKLIEIVEEKKNELINKKTFFSKKLIFYYLNKYDALLLELYAKYEKNM